MILIFIAYRNSLSRIVGEFVGIDVGNPVGRSVGIVVGVAVGKFVHISSLIETVWDPEDDTLRRLKTGSSNSTRVGNGTFPGSPRPNWYLSLAPAPYITLSSAIKNTL